MLTVMQKLNVPCNQQQKVNHLITISWQFCSFYRDDLHQHNLFTQLALLGTLFDGLNKDSIDIPFVINRLRELTEPQKNMFSEIIILAKRLLLAPAKDISERSCSTLRKIKTYFRSTMIKSTESLDDVKHTQGKIGRTESHRNSK